MNPHKNPHKYVLIVSCPSAVGQVAAIALFLDQHQCYVEEIAVFDSHNKSTFYVRCGFFTPHHEADTLPQLRQAFATVAQRFGMDWAMHDSAVKPKVLILVSKYDHCLNDLLYRWRVKELAVEITAVVSNHNDLRSLVEPLGLPYYHWPVAAHNRTEQEEQLLALHTATQTELVVLARYMQILSPRLCALWQGRAINIHHSFLPGFKGAKPYQQAYERGVKVIGATAHYVTTELDEGPIIEQAVTQVDHSFDPEHLQSIGRDMECAALSKAVRLHLERRVFIDGLRTVVLR